MVKCKVCGKEYKKITASHLKKHNLSYDEYLKKYEFKEYFYKRAAELLDRLYITVRYKWDILDHNGEYKRYKKGNKRKWGLSLSDIKNHTKGKKTIAICQPKNRSKFIGLDIDLNSIEVLEDIYKAIKSYTIPEQAILMSFSGNKGYHIDIFLSDMLNSEEIEKFYKLIRLDTGYSKNEIELADNNSSHKLPLGVNFKAKYSDNEGYCYLCNEYGYRLNDKKALDKLENIIPIAPIKIKDILEINETVILTEKEKSEFEEIVNSTKLLDSYSDPLEALVNSIENKGITELGTRHNKAFVLALGYREQGYCSKDIYQKLIQWHKNLNPVYYKTSLAECKEEYKRIADDVFNTDYKLPIKDISKDTFITKEIMKKILSVHKKGRGKKALRRLLFILIIHSEMYADKEGIFYMTYKQMEKAGAIKNDRGKLKKRIDILVNQGHIEVIQRDKRGKGLKHKPNKYRVLGLNNELSEDKFHICDKSKKCDDCMNKAICYFYNEEEIKEQFSYRKAKSILKTDPCPVNV
jgi:hypothetical protein